MKLPKNCTKALLFKHNDSWYQIVWDRDKYILFKKNGENDYTQLGTGSNPTKLEDKVYGGKYE